MMKLSEEKTIYTCLICEETKIFDYKWVFCYQCNVIICDECDKKINSPVCSYCRFINNRDKETDLLVIEQRINEPECEKKLFYYSKLINICYFNTKISIDLKYKKLFKITNELIKIHNVKYYYFYHIYCFVNETLKNYEEAEKYCKTAIKLFNTSYSKFLLIIILFRQNKFIELNVFIDDNLNTIKEIIVKNGKFYPVEILKYINDHIKTKKKIICTLC